MASQRSLYDLLNVSHDAEPVVIEAAYRALMKKYHPDQSASVAKNAPDAAEINQAFAVLRDPKRRAGYDHRLWASSQELQLAERRMPAPPRPRTAFGWTGWLVAALLGAMLFAVVNGRGGLAPPTVNNLAAVEEKQGSQPKKIDPPFAASKSEPTALDREILLREAAESEAAAKAARERERQPEPEPIILADEPPSLSPVPPRTVPPRARSRPARRGAARPRTKAEQDDFLRREGYIY